MPAIGFFINLHQFGQFRLFYLLSVLATFTTLPLIATGGPSAASFVVGLPMSPEVRTEPYFAEEDNLWLFHKKPLSQKDLQETLLTKNVTFHVGETAFLECKIRNLGAQKVSWVRHRDVHILAVGSNTFTSDPRFSSRLVEDEGKMILTIKSVRAGDQGGYECQISTKPTKRFVFNLYVQVHSTRILGESAIHVEKDSGLNLTCLITSSNNNNHNLNWNTKGGETNKQENNIDIHWYKDGKVITDSPNGRHKISNVVTPSGEKQSLFGINQVEVRDSGNYSCQTSTASKATVKVHVLVDGESPNAWKSNAASPRLWTTEELLGKLLPWPLVPLIHVGSFVLLHLQQIWR